MWEDNRASRKTEILRDSQADVERIATAWANMVNKVSLINSKKTKDKKKRTEIVAKFSFFHTKSSQICLNAVKPL